MAVSRWKVFVLGCAVLACGAAGAARAQFYSRDYANTHWNHERQVCVNQSGRWDWDNGICSLPNQTSWRYSPNVTHDTPPVRGRWYNGTYYLTR